MAKRVNTPGLLMMSVADVAKRDKVSKPAVSMKVKQLAAAHGLEVERDNRGRVAKFNVAQYDHLRGKVDDPSKEQRPPKDDPPAAPINDRESYNDALTQKTLYEAETKRLALDEQIGKLVRVDEIAPAIDECGSEIFAAVKRLSSEADALCAVIARDGVHGVRVELKKIENRILGDIAARLDILAKRDPATVAGGAPAQ